MDEKNLFKLSFPIDIINWNGKLITLKKDGEILAQLETLAKAGISNVMLAGLHQEEPLAFNVFKEAARLGAMIQRAGFKISSHHCILPVFAPLSQDQSGVHKTMAETVRFCSQLKARTMVFHPGRISGRHSNVQSIFAGFKTEVAANGVEKVIETAAENLQYMAEAAAAADMRIALENVGKFEPLADYKRLPELVNMANMENIGFCVDSGHAHAFGESLPQWIELAGEKIFETHFHDNHGILSGADLPPDSFIQSSKESDEHLFPGNGTIPWDKVIEALLKVNYRETVTFEVTVKPDDNALGLYKSIISWWRDAELKARNNIEGQK